MHLEKLDEPEHRVPQLTTFTEIPKYFSSYFTFRKQVDPQFSFEIWSAELNFKSKVQMRLICNGKRKITAGVIESFSRKNGLTFKELRHLYLMADYQRARSVTQQRMAFNHLIENLDLTPTELEIEKHSGLLADKNLVLVQLLLGIQDFEGNLTNLHRATGMNRKNLSRYLTTLAELGLIRQRTSDRHNEVCWFADFSHFKVADTPHNDALKIFHKQTVEEMGEMLDQHPVMRRFRSLLFALGENNFAEFIEDSESFIKKIENKYGAKTINGKYIFKLNLNAYPVTEKVT